MSNLFKVVEVTKTLSKQIQVLAVYESITKKVFKARCFWIGKVNELSFHNDQEFVLNTFLAPVELCEGEFIYSGEASNFKGFEVSYCSSKQTEEKEKNDM